VSVKNIINNAFLGENIECTTDRVVKGKNGHRSCKVTINNKTTMNEVFFALNEVKGVVGMESYMLHPSLHILSTYPSLIKHMRRFTETLSKTFLCI
jgi:hypothetical protein